MIKRNSYPNFFSVFGKRPHAFAEISGSEDYPQIEGIARFWQTAYGVIMSVELRGLPKATDVCSSPIFAVHIHDGESCTGNEEDPFANAGMHFNPHSCPHPYHAGDLPPLFSSNEYAFSTFLTDRFIVDEIIGKTIIVHSSPDDFTTQPSGNSGIKIACGEIYR